MLQRLTVLLRLLVGSVSPGSLASSSGDGSGGKADGGKVDGPKVDGVRVDGAALRRAHCPSMAAQLEAIMELLVSLLLARQGGGGAEGTSALHTTHTTPRPRSARRRRNQGPRQ